MSDLEVVAEPGRQDIVVRRGFDAPRDVVFEAMTDPRYLAQWWGRKESELHIDRFEPRSGGSWRVVEKDADGGEYAFHGVFHEVTAPERYVQTFEFEGQPGHVLLETHSLEDEGERTVYTAYSVFQSVEDRDGMVDSGMETGLTESMDALEALLRTMT
ncbi:SRPBCC family protein [Nocardiopsis sp. YSL2]|uniref:SRPBCC family protein n=1 Tax=Nocardiopsis sp. YSL2 TaxID=2939492 RepID=UPI0026F4119D|nr:SRPBCC family protein [Nocardiopsis sp. YSL2]